jgi:hypothetical protein
MNAQRASRSVLARPSTRPTTRTSGRPAARARSRASSAGVPEPATTSPVPAGRAASSRSRPFCRTSIRPRNSTGPVPTGVVSAGGAIPFGMTVTVDRGAYPRTTSASTSLRTTSSR